jgi:hypothetical protein
MAFADRFWAKVEQSNDCWEWRGARGAEGYGQMRLAKRGAGSSVRAHRVAWELRNGAVPDGLSVLHSCDNRGCVRPDHLFLGTRADNNRDRDLKGRAAKGARHGTHTTPESYRGERQWRAKLTSDDVLRIRSRFAGGATKLGLSREFGVSRRTVRSILSGENWGWLS